MEEETIRNLIIGPLRVMGVPMYLIGDVQATFESKESVEDGQLTLSAGIM